MILDMWWVEHVVQARVSVFVYHVLRMRRVGDQYDGPLVEPLVAERKHSAVHRQHSVPEVKRDERHLARKSFTERSNVILLLHIQFKHFVRIKALGTNEYLSLQNKRIFSFGVGVNQTQVFMCKIRSEWTSVWGRGSLWVQKVFFFCGSTRTFRPTEWVLFTCFRVRVQKLFLSSENWVLP